MPFSNLEKEGHFASQNPGCKSTRLGGRREAEPQSLSLTADNNGLQEHREAEEPEGTAGAGRNTTTHTVRPD